MCNTIITRSSGAGLYVLGLLVAGVMFMVIGAQYNEDNPKQKDLKTFFWVYSIAMLLAAIGLVLDNGNRFCGEEEFKGADYFGGLFQVVAVFAWAALGVGIAHYYEDSTYGALGAADERSALAWLSGVASIFFAFGALFMLKEILCCEGFKCNMVTIFEITNMVLQLALVVFWFLWAEKMSKAGNPALLATGAFGLLTKEKDLTTYSYLIGVVYILMALLGSLLFLDICCGGDKPEPKPYGNDGYDDKPAYGEKPGYGDNGGGGGYDDTTTGYGQQRPQPAY